MYTFFEGIHNKSCASAHPEEFPPFARASQAVASNDEEAIAVCVDRLGCLQSGMATSPAAPPPRDSAQQQGGQGNQAGQEGGGLHAGLGLNLGK
jgi:hypothetical protein